MVEINERKFVPLHLWIFAAFWMRFFQFLFVKLKKILFLTTTFKFIKFYFFCHNFWPLGFDCCAKKSCFFKTKKCHLSYFFDFLKITQDTRLLLSPKTYHPCCLVPDFAWIVTSYWHPCFIWSFVGYCFCSWTHQCL